MIAYLRTVDKIVYICDYGELFGNIKCIVCLFCIYNSGSFDMIFQAFKLTFGIVLMLVSAYVLSFYVDLCWLWLGGRVFYTLNIKLIITIYYMVGM